jgi:hypothetical protein
LVRVGHNCVNGCVWPTETLSDCASRTSNCASKTSSYKGKSRALIRNGMARLWWYGHCYDETRSDPFELTTALLKNLDVSQSILERAFSLNTSVTKTMLSVLLDREKDGNAFYVRDKLRNLAKYMVQIGGVTIIDTLDIPDLRELVKEKIEQLTAA